MQGIYRIYKPKGLSSLEIIKALRKITGIRHIGQAGRLGRQTAGVLVLGLGQWAVKKLKNGRDLLPSERKIISDFTRDKPLTLEQFKKEYRQRKKIMSLCLVRRKNQILLGLKKRGFGSNRWNGFGGKVQAGEKIEKTAAREIKEEVGLTPLKMKKKAVLIFEFQDNPSLIEVHVFGAENFRGQVKESEEMKPKWFNLNKIPYRRMWPDDIHWLPLFLKGKKLRGEFYFKDINTLLYYSLRIVKKI